MESGGVKCNTEMDQMKRLHIVSGSYDAVFISEFVMGSATLNAHDCQHKQTKIHLNLMH